ncbi:hypothetical protein C8F04DRAFT_1077444 [Mycena alexandri]|uniref:Protein-S-isoprenylcysteine O-methyltransferase n=1 Tax=Mycena alexandri TaxID=1745969 RepID=A0AAD6TAA4_9AGAR|nr:hypothetical protein C8F04DRAFT_1077444 [Mycena alexandri]
MSTLKIPLLLAVALGTHATMTPPNPPPTPAEQLPPRGIERAAPKWIPLLLKGFFLTCTLAETTVLLPRLLPELFSIPFAQRSLEIFDPAHGAPRLALTPLFLTGAALTLFGSALRVHCYAALRTLFTFELGIRRDHQLITTGPYATVRHPSYAGAALAGVGVVMCTLAPGSWAVECTGLFTRRRIATLWIVGLVGAGMGLRTRMKMEDRMLKERFGKEWETWATRVPRWILPGVY